tara:strand:- start:34 stop:243 length:210 start_codon:yes stop_codon:yes gene_type:complete
MWRWPSPSEHFISGKNNNLSFTGTKEISNNFTLLKISINEVDQLLLDNPIHIRRSWLKKKEWFEERINP